MSLRAARVAVLARACPLTLLLDLDGTLIPFAPTPEEAMLDDEAADLLRSLSACGIRIAVVSGRPRPFLMILFAIVDKNRRAS